VRRWIWPDGAVSDAEAEVVFDLNRLARDPGPEWADFFIEAMTDHVVNSAAPRGYVDEAGAAWLIEQIDRDGAPISPLELELVVKVLESALDAPASLKAYALRQIEASVLNGEGPTRGRPVRPGTIDEAEVGLLRRIIFAAGGDGALVVSQDEAETLWRLKDESLGADNAPGWKTLFVQAVGNHLMAYSSYRPLDRGEAARLEAFVEDRRGGVLGFFGRMRPASPAEAARSLLGGARSAAGHDEAVGAARAITPLESAWLKQRLDADGARDPLEEALLAFIAEESGQRPLAS
jgi:hypothetical protein